MPPPSDVLGAIAELEMRVTALINTAVSSLTATMNTIQVEQERRYATFASSARLDELVNQVHGHGNKLQAMRTQQEIISRELTDACHQIDRVEQELNTRSLGFLQGTTGYLVTFLMLVIVSVISLTIGHLIK